MVSAAPIELHPAGTNLRTVIKLKQVEHVRNERKSLVAVNGHPFITNLVASFSDELSLYMLVRFVYLYPISYKLLTSRSWTFALEVRSLPISDACDASTKRPRDSTPRRLQ